MQVTGSPLNDLPSLLFGGRRRWAIGDVPTVMGKLTQTKRVTVVIAIRDALAAQSVVICRAVGSSAVGEPQQHVAVATLGRAPAYKIAAA